MNDFFSQLGILVAFLAGIFSFFAPCTFSLMPVYFAYITGEAATTRKDESYVIFSACFFALGFMMFFMLLGLSVGGLSLVLAQYADVIRIIGALLFMTLGALMILKNTTFFSAVPISFSLEKYGRFAPFFLGVTLAFSSTPCIGPVIGAIITFAFKDGLTFLPLLYLFIYTLGFMVPFIIFGFLFTRLVRSRTFFLKFVSHFHFLSGLLLITLGGIMLFDGLDVLTIFIQGLYHKYNIPFVS